MNVSLPAPMDAERALALDGDDDAFGREAALLLTTAYDALVEVDRATGRIGSLALDLRTDGAVHLPAIPERLGEGLTGHRRLAVHARLAEGGAALDALRARLPACGPRLSVRLMPPRYTLTAVCIRAEAEGAAAATGAGRHEMRILGGRAECIADEAALRFARLHAVVRRGRLYRPPGTGPAWSAVIAVRWEDRGSYAFQRHQLTVRAPDAGAAATLALACAAEGCFVSGAAPLGCPVLTAVESVAPVS